MIIARKTYFILFLALTIALCLSGQSNVIQKQTDQFLSDGKLDESNDQISFYLKLGKEAFEKGNYREALRYAKTLNSNNDSNSNSNCNYVNSEQQHQLRSLADIKLLIAKTYQKLGDSKNSLEAYKKHYAIKDSLEKIINNELVHTLENKYTTALQDHQLNRLKVQNSLQDLRLNQQRWKGLLIIIFLALLSGTIFLLYRKNKQIKIQTHTISETVNEKNILLKEIHHRVKNNLQVISSLFKLQSRYVSDETALAALQEGRNRVNSMAILHQNLYQEDNLKGIEMPRYIEQLCEAILQSSKHRNIDLSFQNNIEPLTLDIDTVIPLGLILTEFLTQPLKLEFKNILTPIIKVSLTEKNESLILKVQDNGSTIKKSPKDAGQLFSQKIIRAFSKKLKASYEHHVGTSNESILVVKRYKKASSNSK